MVGVVSWKPAGFPTVSCLEEDRRKARIQATLGRLKSSTHWVFWVPTRIHYCIEPMVGEVLRGLGPAEKDVTAMSARSKPEALYCCLLPSAC